MFPRTAKTPDCMPNSLEDINELISPKSWVAETQTPSCPCTFWAILTDSRLTSLQVGYRAALVFSNCAKGIGLVFLSSDPSLLQSWECAVTLWVWGQFWGTVFDDPLLAWHWSCSVRADRVLCLQRYSCPILSLAYGTRGYAQPHQDYCRGCLCLNSQWCDPRLRPPWLQQQLPCPYQCLPRHSVQRSVSIGESSLCFCL